MARKDFWKPVEPVSTGVAVAPAPAPRMPLPEMPRLARSDRPLTEQDQRLANMAEARLNAILGGMLSPDLAANEYAASRLRAAREPDPAALLALAALGGAGAVGSALGMHQPQQAERPGKPRKGEADYIRKMIPNLRRTGTKESPNLAENITKPPEEVVREALASLAPESPNLKKLYGITRADLADRIGANQASVVPELYNAPRGAPYARELANPERAAYIREVLQRALAEPRLRHTAAWYDRSAEMKLLNELVGPEEAVRIWDRRNQISSPLSAMASPAVEIQRAAQAAPDISAVLGTKWPGTNALARYQQTGTFFSPDWARESPKTPLYYMSQGMGVPGSPLQTKFGVPDSHDARSTGLPLVRPGGDMESMTGPEAGIILPWHTSEIFDPLGLQGQEGQALKWSTFYPGTITGRVRTPIGQGREELQADFITKWANEHGLPPELVRDAFTLGMKLPR